MSKKNKKKIKDEIDYINHLCDLINRKLDRKYKLSLIKVIEEEDDVKKDI